MDRNIIDKSRDYYKRFGFFKTLIRVFTYSTLKIKNKWYGYIISKSRNEEDFWEPLRKILMTNKNDIEFIDIFHVPMGWETPLFQRFQHISLNVGSVGGISFYGAHPTVDKDVAVIKQINPRLFLVNFDNPIVKQKFFELLDEIQILRIIRLQSIDLATTIEELKRYMDKGYHIVYEYIDELTPDITGAIPDFVFERHKFVLNHEAISVVTTSEKLFEDAGQYRERNLIMSCNGVDFSHWNNVDAPLPFDMQNVVNQKLPIVGYHGALAKWLDYELLKIIADTEKYSVVLIGYEHDLSLSDSGLKQHPHVFFLGPKDYNILNQYCKYYDIAIIPFIPNNITQSVSPVKLFEYMAAEKPIVSYGLRECRKYQSCLIADTREGFVEQLENALAKKTDNEYIEMLKREALENTWRSKTVEMIELVKAFSDATLITADENIRKKYVEQIVNIPKKESVDYVELTQKPYIWTGKEPKILAYYLPQFYPFKENDEWWGKGTTEWNNVSRAVPQYIDHYQPRLPGELGYYDLRLKENLVRQVELAKMYGIYGFAYYYYWFDGKRLLDKPLDMLLDNKDIDMPFCLCWANENWTKKFDGTNSDVIMEQPKNIESYKNMIHDAVRYMKDSRYITVNGKKLFVIYRPSFIPDFEEVLSYWRAVVKAEGAGELYIIAIKEHTAELNLLQYGFDAVGEFHPGTLYRYCNDITGQLPYIRNDFKGQVLDYKDIVLNKKYFLYNTEKLYRAIMPMWDNTARRDNQGMIFEGATPKLYQTWLEDILKESSNKDLDVPMVFINAWNEWGEGTYMEPDRRYGYAYLEATKRALEGI